MSTVTLAAVGDILVNRARPQNALSGIRPILAAADLTFGNFEGVLTDTDPVVPGAMATSVSPTRNAHGLVGIDVVSLANNHTMDAGSAGLTSTTGTLSGLGIATAGAGPTLAEALRPAVLPCNGLRVAIVAVTAVLQHGAEALPRTPGVAPLRADDCYLTPYPGGCAPGLAPRVLSVLNEADWEAVAGALRAAREAADVVLASVHWGDHTRPWVLTDHERLCAELLTEAGADAVLGHHQHTLRGVEMISGRPVFFGLGHAAVDLPGYAAALADRGLDVAESSEDQLRAMFGEHGIYPRPQHPAFPFPPLARHTAVAVIELAATGVVRFGLVPCHIDGDGVAQPIRRGEPGWPAAMEILQRCQRTPALRTTLVDTGWELGGYDIVELAGPVAEEA